MNIRDLDDIDMQSDEDVRNMLDQFERDWNEPTIRTLAAAVIRTSPPEVVAELRRRAPDAVKELEGTR